MKILTNYLKKVRIRNALVEELKKNKLKIPKRTVDDMVKVVMTFDKSFAMLQKLANKKPEDESKYMYMITHNLLSDVDNNLLMPKMEPEKKEETLKEKVDYIG